MQTRLQRKAAPAGANPIFRTRSRYAKKIHAAYAKRSGVAHWDLSDKNADTNETSCKGSNRRRGNTNLGPFGAEWSSITSN